VNYGSAYVTNTYNMYLNSIDITTFNVYILRINCRKTEEGLKTTAWMEHDFKHFSLLVIHFPKPSMILTALRNSMNPNHHQLCC